MTTIKSWSPTRLTDFESCAYKAKLKLIDKIPEPERPLPPGKTEHANDRGTRIHSEIELFVRGQGPFPADVAVFKDELNNLATRYKNGTVSLEGEWGFDRNWQPCDYNGAWLRMKCDAVVHLSPKHIVVIDFKGLPLDTLLPTPTGWTTMKSVVVGDKLIDRLGNICTVTAKSSVKQLGCYEIVFDDTTKIICDEEHRWTLTSGEVKCVTDLQIGDFIPTAEPLQLPEAQLPLDPYVLGIWLADGKHTSGEIAKPDEFIWQEIQRRGFEISHNYEKREGFCQQRTVKGLRTKLTELNILGDKQIPQIYLRASSQQRLDLLRGIMDGDGSANHKRKQVTLNTIRLDFAEQVSELLLSLGQRSLISPYVAKGYGKEVQAYYVSFRPRNLNPFLLPRKADKVLITWGAGESWRRRVQRVTKVMPTPTQCVMVDSPDHTFLCSRQFVPTHNTGRKFGNEIKHAEQVQIYAIAAIIRNPNAETIDVELWYSDQKPGQNFTHESKPAKKWLYHLKAFHNRGLKMTSETEFKPNPNAFSCKWCPYREGICQYAHKYEGIKPVRRKGQ